MFFIRGRYLEKYRNRSGKFVGAGVTQKGAMDEEKFVQMVGWTKSYGLPWPCSVPHSTAVDAKVRALWKKKGKDKTTIAWFFDKPRTFE